jgi:hypothetical protein
MAVHGRIEIRIDSGSTASTDFFVTLHNFLLGLPGVTRIASSNGSGGTGIDYRDAPTTIGTNAFAVFRFGNAQIPFYVLIQCVNTTGSGTAIATPGNFSTYPGGGTTSFGVMIAIAQRLDGTSPWAGTTTNNGTDTKSSPVWTPGTSALSVFPRANAVGGAFATNREAMMMLNTVNLGSTEADQDIFAFGMRAQFLADDDSLMIMQDRSSDGSFAWFFFGRYTPRPGLSIQAPYVCLQQQNGTNDPIVPSYTWGSTTQSTSLTWVSSGDGGIAHPVVASGVKIVATDGTNTMFNSVQYSPNRASGTAGRFDLVPVYVVINETPNIGFLGTIPFFRTAYNLPPMYLSPDRKLAAFGNGSISSGKIVVPWDGITAPNSGINRQGISF